jgi:hypothetical protein
MSWIKDHVRQFVVPGIRTIARANGRVLVDEDIKRVDKALRPSSKCEYLEAGLIYSLVASILPKSNETREVALGLCRQVGKAGDAEFVYELDLGGRGVDNRVKDLAFGYRDVEGADVLHSFISNSVKELKRRTKKKATAIYPGRDVWCWEVMSQRQGMPSHYDAKVSRSIATHEKAMAKVIEPWDIPDWEKTVLFDTGHAGTVPRAIGRAAGVQRMLVIMLSAKNNEEQLFRTHAKSRKKALACEYLAKYRKRATVKNDEPYQELADLEEFIKAALLTIWLWYHISPARLPAWQDQEVIKAKGGLRFGKSGGLTIGNSNLVSVTPINNGHLFGTTLVDPWASSATTTPSVLSWANTSTASGTTWGPTIVGNGTGTIDLAWGGTGMNVLTALADASPVIPPVQHNMVDPATFQLLDGVSKTPLEPAMDAKAAGLDPVQYEIQKSRAELRGRLEAVAPGGFKGDPLKKFERIPARVTMDASNTKIIADNRPPPPPKGVNMVDHLIALQAPKSLKKIPGQVTGKDIVAYETAKLNAATAVANSKTAKLLEPLKDKLPEIMARSNAPPGQLPLVSLGIEIDKDTGAAHKTVTYKSPLISNQPGGVPLANSVPTPTTGQGNPVKPVTDGRGKAII